MSDEKNTFTFEEITNRLSLLFKEEGLEIVLLFGSFVKGGIHKRSDIDLAFQFDKPIDILSLTNRVIRLLHTDNIDVIDLKRSSPLLRYSIAKNGRILYEKSPGMFNEFCSLAFKMYVDTKKLRNAQAKALRQYLQAKGLL
ncbi:MAG: nucleotidyltransferase domain-containing protein [Nitrospirae bacterium]|nr:nucleotidyltransferase domain-containing protein [Nitrospirota bacterium]